MPKNNFSASKDVLIFDYENRKKRNSRFSKRHYASLLGISSGRLTEIFEGRAPITLQRARRLLPKLHLEESEKKIFLGLAEKEASLRSLRLRVKKRRSGTREETIRPKEVLSLSFAVDPKKLVVVKSLLQEFASKLEKILGSPKGTETYQLEIVLAPSSSRKSSDLT